MIDLFHAITSAETVEQYWGALRVPPSPINALMSYPYVPAQIDELLRLKSAGMIRKLFMDSNTFALNPKGQWNGVYKFDEYYDHVDRFGKYFDHLASYDYDFGDKDRNWEAHVRLMQKLRGNKLADKIIPVVHSTDGASQEFSDYIEHGAQHIGIGSRPTINKQEWKIIEQLRRDHNIRIHIFGNLGQNLLLNKRPDTADSGRYFHAASRGDILYWNPAIQKIESIKVIKDARIEHQEYILRTFGSIESIDTLGTTEKWPINIYAIEQMALWFRTQPAPQVR